MKSIAASCVLLYAVVASASAVADDSLKSRPALFSLLPQCAEQCVADASIALCKTAEDYMCRCNPHVKDRIVSASMACVVKACDGPEEASQYRQIHDRICNELNRVELKHQDLKRAASSTTSAPSSTASSGSGGIAPALTDGGSWVTIRPSPASEYTGTALTKGALVGVCLGVPLAAFLLLAVVYKIFSKRKQRNRATQAKMAAHDDDAVYGKAPDFNSHAV